MAAWKAVQKQMPTDWHAFLQLAFAKYLDIWAADRGKVGTEWRFMVPPNDFNTKSVVPDVAYLANDRYLALSKSDRKYPIAAPDIVVEILSPDDRAIDVAAKRRLYLWWRVRLVITVDPETRTVETHEADNVFKTFSEFEELRCTAFPDLVITLSELFKAIKEPD